MKTRFATILLAALTTQSALAVTRPLTCPLISEIKNIAEQVTVTECHGGWCGMIDNLTFGKHKWSLHVSALKAVDAGDAKAKAIITINNMYMHLGPGIDNGNVWYCQYFSQDDSAVFLVTPPQT